MQQSRIQWSGELREPQVLDRHCAALARNETDEISCAQKLRYFLTGTLFRRVARERVKKRMSDERQKPTNNANCLYLSQLGRRRVYSASLCTVGTATTARNCKTPISPSSIKHRVGMKEVASSESKDESDLNVRRLTDLANYNYRAWLGALKGLRGASSRRVPCRAFPEQSICFLLEVTLL